MITGTTHSEAARNLNHTFSDRTKKDDHGYQQPDVNLKPTSNEEEDNGYRWQLLSNNFFIQIYVVFSQECCFILINYNNKTVHVSPWSTSVIAINICKLWHILCHLLLVCGFFYSNLLFSCLFEHLFHQTFSYILKYHSSITWLGCIHNNDNWHTFKLQHSAPCFFDQQSYTNTPKLKHLIVCCRAIWALHSIISSFTRLNTFFLDSFLIVEGNCRPWQSP